MSRFADDGYDEIDELIDTDPIELGRRYRALLAKYEEISKAKPETKWIKLDWSDFGTHPTEDFTNDHCVLFFNECTSEYFVGSFDYEIEVIDDDGNEVETPYVEVPNTEIVYDAESTSQLWWSPFYPCYSDD